MRTSKTILVSTLLILSGLTVASAQGTAFTYQGRLCVNGSPANGSYDFRLRLSSDSLGNNYLDGTLLTNGVPVNNAVFTVLLDFGANFPSADRWLEIGVRSNGIGADGLPPLQTLNPQSSHTMKTKFETLQRRVFP